MARRFSLAQSLVEANLTKGGITKHLDTVKKYNITDEDIEKLNTIIKKIDELTVKQRQLLADRKKCTKDLNIAHDELDSEIARIRVSAKLAVDPVQWHDFGISAKK